MPFFLPVFFRWFLRLGPINPIAVRLVQNGSRRARHLYIRSAYLAVLIIALLWLLILKTNSGGSLDYRGLASAASFSFTSIAYLQVALICILAPVFMGGAIAQEANPRTWEVLLTTPLTPSEIVLGNLFGRLFFIIALLFASLPLFALTQYFGGVPGSAIFASYAVAGCAALLVGAIAISLSVSRLVGKRAFFVFYVCVVSYLGVTIAIDAWMTGSGRGAGINGTGVTWMTAINPFLALKALLNPTTYARAPQGSQIGLARWFLESPVTTWCLGSALLSAFFISASTLTVRAGGLATLGQDAAVPWYRKLLGFGAAGAEHRAPRQVWTNPIAWREAAARNATLGKVIARWLFVVAGAIGGGAIVFMYANGSINLDEFRFILSATVWTELAVITLVAINMSATAISREREDGTLDLLLTTPITASAYLTGKLRGLIAYLIPILSVPLITLGFAALFTVLGPTQQVTAAYPGGTGNAPATGPIILPEGALAAPFVVIPFAAFCVMVGLQWSLKSRGTLGSVVASVGVIGITTGIVGLCSWNMMGGLPVAGPAIAALSPASAIGAIVNPLASMGDAISKDPTGTRVAFLLGSLASATIYAGICYGIHSAMVRGFDMTVRKLAGNK
jgi:ABC-type transport system involved in multi-copper enzyme maturation permease subunit